MTVLPLSLCRAFAHSREWAVDLNEYQNGEMQVRARPAASRKAWKQSKSLTSAELSTLRTFFFDRKGATEAFYVYDGTERTPKWSWDPTGASTVGRYTVRFAGDRFQQTVTNGRHSVDIEFLEVA